MPKPPSRWLSRAALAPLAVPGFVLYFIPYWIPSLVAERTARDSADDVSTIKLGVALVVYPLWAAGLVGMSLVLIPPPLSLLAALVVVASPFAALRWLDAYWERTVHHEATPDELANLARLRIAGAIPIGKTNMPEFGSTAFTKNLLFGVTRNPWNTARTPGGSSGGSSAAVAATNGFACASCQIMTASFWPGDRR